VNTISQQPELREFLRAFSRCPSEHVRGAVTISGIIALSAAAMAHVSSQETSPPAAGLNPRVMGASPPTPPPFILREIAPRDAQDLNRRIPFSTDPITPARPYKMAGDHGSFERAVECLATAIYYEAGAEPLDGQRAVAQVVLNRVRHPAFVPSVCGVVYQRSSGTNGCQFSFVCDGSLQRRPSQRGWVTARAIAAAALKGSVFAPVGYSTHYHADYVVPYWATSLAKEKIIGRHIFYGWPNWWGTAAAFSNRPISKEPDPRALRAMAVTLFAKSQGVPVDPPPNATLSPDSLELVKVIEFLAARAPAKENANAEEEELRQYFSRYSDHVAVQIYRQLSVPNGRFNSKSFLETMMLYSAPPELAPVSEPSPEVVTAIGGKPRLVGFISSLRDFAKQTDFDKFMRQRQSRYAEGHGDGSKIAR